MLLCSTLQASVFMVKITQNIYIPSKIQEKDLTMKQMFDMSEKLMAEQSDDFLECLRSIGKVLHGNNYLLSMMKKSSVYRIQRFMYVFSDSMLCLGKVNQSPASNTVWEQQLDWFKDSSQYRTLDTIDGEPMEFQWNISQDSLHCSSSKKSKSS